MFRQDEVKEAKDFDYNCFRSTIQTLNLERSQVFNTSDVMPTNMFAPMDLTARATWVGSDYKRGRVVLLGLNPAGGGQKYKNYTALHDREWADQIQILKEQNSFSEYLKWRDEVAPKCIRRWSIRLSIDAVLDALKLSLKDVAIGNLIPFRMEGGEAENIKSHHFQMAWDSDTAEVLSLLEPRLIVCMTSKIKQLRKRYDGSAIIEQFRRARGDKHITPLGQEDLKILRNYRRGYA
jgi:hypothetical protein